MSPSTTAAVVADALAQQAAMSPVPPARSSTRSPRFTCAGADEVALPHAVDAQRHQVVHQVVLARDRGEHFADQLLLLADGTSRKPKWVVPGLGRFAHAAIIASCPGDAPWPGQRTQPRYWHHDAAMPETTPTIQWKALHFRDLDLDLLYALLRLRAEVFVVEQDCAYLDPDGKDHHSETIHLLGGRTMARSLPTCASCRPV
jgi:hypothetical protein